VAVENALRALRADLFDLPDGAREALLAVIGEVLFKDDEREEPSNGDHAEGR
jgi:hypothetical protein